MKRYGALIPAIAWMAVIFVLSTSLFGAQETGSIVARILRALMPWLSQADIETTHLVIRKTAHLTEYAILCLLLRRGFAREGLGGAKAASLAFLVSALYAASDEFHQSFVANRTASPVDALIDMSGAALALAGRFLWPKQKQRRL